MLSSLHAGGRDRLLSSASTAASSDDLEQNVPKSASEVGSGGDANSIRDIMTGQSSGGNSTPEFSISFERNLRAASRMAWAHLAVNALIVMSCIGGAKLALTSSSLGSSYMVYMLMFAIVAPICYCLKFNFQQVIKLDREHCITVMSVCIQNQYQRHLMEGLRWKLAQTPGLENYSEATVEGVEDPSGSTSLEVELRPSRDIVNLRLQRGTRSEPLTLELSGGEAASGGMPSRAILQIRSTDRLQFLSAAFRGHTAKAQMQSAQDDARAFLHAWLQHVYADYMRTSTGVIEVYELTKDKADAPLFWARVRKERCVSVRGKGTFTYCPCDWAVTLKNRAEYAVCQGGKNRVVLFLSGEKGSGKTLFVEWLAGTLCLPLYSMDLSSQHVNNEVIREMITPTKLAHNLPVIFHFDEFQSIIHEWSQQHAGDDTVRKRRSQVTIQGMQSILEGSSTPNNAIFVFTSSQPMPTLDQISILAAREQHEWRGLLRRLPVQVQIPVMGPDQRKEYCQRFLSAYLNRPWDPSCPHEASRWAAFEKEWGQVRNGIPFDMVAKYAQERIQVAYIAGMLTSFPEGCKVKDSSRETFLDSFFSPKHVEDWIAEYAGSAASASSCQASSTSGTKS